MSESVAKASDDSPTGERYSVRERVHDKENPDGILVVLEAGESRADEYELTDGVTVAQFNPVYPDSDRVVLCAYQHTLDRKIPDWRELPKGSLLDRYESTDEQIHALPASRADRYVAGNYTETAHGVHCENCDTRLETATGWLEHIARNCPEVESHE